MIELKTSCQQGKDPGDESTKTVVLQHSSVACQQLFCLFNAH